MDKQALLKEEYRAIDMLIKLKNTYDHSWESEIYVCSLNISEILEVVIGVIKDAKVKVFDP